jgi:hypothetical protein
MIGATTSEIVVVCQQPENPNVSGLRRQRPVDRAPSTMNPAPTPVPTVMYAPDFSPLSDPKLCSAKAAALTSVSSSTGSPNVSING